MNYCSDDEVRKMPHILLLVHAENSGCSLLQQSMEQRRQFAHVNEAVKAALDWFAGAAGRITVVDHQNVQILTVRTSAAPWLRPA